MPKGLRSLTNRPDRKASQAYKNYPIDAINELVKNAIAHRDYSIMGGNIYFEIDENIIRDIVYVLDGKINIRPIPDVKTGSSLVAERSPDEREKWPLPKRI